MYQQLPLFGGYNSLESPFIALLAHHDVEVFAPVIDDLIKKQEKLERDIKLLKYLFVRRA